MNPMNNLIRHITSFIFISLSLSAYPISYSFRGLSETNGLSDLTVSALYKDSVGSVSYTHLIIASFTWSACISFTVCADIIRLSLYIPS